MTAPTIDLEVGLLRAPFPWFGGKRRVAPVVWEAFGADVPNYIEPFFGSGAVLLGRPGGPGKIETVNDADRYLANFWRAIAADPAAVAAHADWPVNEADMHARHKWLVNQAEFRERMHVEPEYFDVKIAGWWVWGLCMWIGGGWCVEPKNHKHPKFDGIGKGVHSQRAHPREREAKSRPRPKMSADSLGMGVHSEAARRRGADRTGEANRPGRGIHAEHVHEPPRQMPSLSVGTARGVGSGGRGVHGARAHGEEDHRKRPGLDGTSAGRGVHSLAAAAYSPGRRPAISGAGQGVHLPSLGNDRGLNGVAAPPGLDWFRALQARLRRVRVACGDWTRVLGPSVLGKGKNVGGRRPCAVFLDPPYSFEVRDPYLYAEDDAAISTRVREWALEHGDDRELRIALCGYEGEHEMPSSWRCFAWKAARGYAAADNENRARERIWFSPYCLQSVEANRQQQLFTEEVSP